MSMKGFIEKMTTAWRIWWLGVLSVVVSHGFVGLAEVTRDFQVFAAAQGLRAMGVLFCLVAIMLLRQNGPPWFK